MRIEIVLHLVHLVPLTISAVERVAQLGSNVPSRHDIVITTFRTIEFSFLLSSVHSSVVALQTCDSTSVIVAGRRIGECKRELNFVPNS